MFSKIPFRKIYMLFGSILTLAFWFLISPENAFITELPFGATVIVLVAALLKAVLFVTFLHISRKALFDYINMGEIYRKCLEDPQGAGLFAIAVSLAMVAIAICVIASGFIG